MLVTPIGEAEKKTLAKRRRGPSQIILGILEVAAGNGATKSTLVYKSGLTFGRMEKYLSLLTTKNFLEVHGIGPKIYRTTAKGEDVKQKMLVLQELMFGADAQEAPADILTLGW